MTVISCSQLMRLSEQHLDGKIHLGEKSVQIQFHDNELSYHRVENIQLLLSPCLDDVGCIVTAHYKRLTVMFTL